MKNGHASLADLLQKGESSEFGVLPDFSVSNPNNRLSSIRMVRVERRKFHCTDCDGDRMFSA
ncbi:MAG: hypothetical protein ACREX5_10970, partial [Achromobacter pestifer]